MARGKRPRRPPAASPSNAPPTPKDTTSIERLSLEVVTLPSDALPTPEDTASIKHSSLEVVASPSDAPPTPEDTASPRRKVRQNTRGIGLSKLVQANGRVKLTIRPEIGKPTCRYSTTFANECGVIVRSFAPQQVKNWHNIPEKDKELLFNRLLEKFDIDLNMPHVRKCCYNMMAGRFRDFRSRCHNHFKKFSSVQQAKKHKYHGILHDIDWKWLCDYFDSDEFKHRSQVNSSNHKRQKYNHFCGTKSFLSHMESQRDPKTGNEQSRIELFLATRYKQGKGWINEQAEADYARMREMQMTALSQSQGDGPPMTDDEIYNEVLGKRSWYVKGLGYVQKSAVWRTRSASINETVGLMQQKLDEHHEKLNEAYSLIAALQEENRAMWAELNELHEMLK